jgi:hypothetical protein
MVEVLLTCYCRVASANRKAQRKTRVHLTKPAENNINSDKDARNQHRQSQAHPDDRSSLTPLLVDKCEKWKKRRRIRESVGAGVPKWEVYFL